MKTVMKTEEMLIEYFVFYNYVTHNTLLVVW